jgi:polyisoprenoid-binding protein YceI
MRKTMFYAAAAFLVTVLAACGGSTENQVSTYKLNETSLLKWKGIYADDSHDHYGTVEVKDGEIVYKGDVFQSGTFNVAMATIESELTPETGRDKLHSYLHSARFFNSDAYPTVKVEVTAIDGDKADLIIHVNKKEIKTTAPLSIKKTAEKIQLKGDFSVDFTALDAPGFKPDPEEEKIKPNQFVKPVVEFGLDITLTAEQAK